MKPEKTEAKLLTDIEEVHNLMCLIHEPTRITPSTSTLIDILLTNRPDYFKHSGAFDPSLSDHCMIYGLMKRKTQTYKRKTITFRSKKGFDENKYLRDLEYVPWHVGEILILLMTSTISGKKWQMMS